MEALDHPRKAEAQALRDIVRASGPHLVESLKWNAPSYALGADHLLLEWASDIRAIATFRNADDLAHAGPLLPGLIGEWITASQAG